MVNITKNRRLQVGLSAGSHFITDIYQSAYIGLIPFLTAKFGLSLFQVSLMAASTILANSLFSPVFGILSDRHGLKYYLVVGPLFTSIFLSLLGILPGFYLILIFLFLGNLSIAAYHPASAAVAGHFGGRRKGIASSLINLGGNLGNALGSLIIILILEKLGIEYTPLAMVPGIITALVLLRYAPSKDEITEGKKITFSWKKLAGVNRYKIALLAIIMFMVYSLYVIWITLVNYMPLYYTQKNVSLINIGNILLVFGAMGGASGLFSGYLYDHFKKGNIVLQAAIILAVPLFYLTFRTEGLLSIALFILGGFFMISAQPVCIRMAQDLLPGNMSLASSLILGLSPGIAGITMIFLGKAADRIGIVNLVYYEFSGLGLAFILLLFFPLIQQKLRLHP
jgi:MFS transporter, FSR family, fosmidomycin resistance protein